MNGNFNNKSLGGDNAGEDDEEYWTPEPGELEMTYDPDEDADAADFDRWEEMISDKVWECINDLELVKDKLSNSIPENCRPYMAIPARVNLLSNVIDTLQDNFWNVLVSGE